MQNSEEGAYSDRNIHQKYPVPGILVGQIAADHRTQSGGDNRRDRGDGECRLALFGRECVEDDCLLSRLQAAAEEALHCAEDQQFEEIGGDATKQ